MLLRYLHRVASIGWVYDLIQKAVGTPAVLKRLRLQFAQCAAGDRVLDVGGGTGFIGKILPRHCVYYCLDIEPPKLRRYVDKSVNPKPILADATQMPVSTSSIDVVVCAAVVHHLAPDVLASVLNEILRVLKPEGRMILFDPVEDSQRWMSKFLWLLDRGAYPRTSSALRSCFESRFVIHQWEELVGYHRYVLAIGTR